MARINVVETKKYMKIGHRVEIALAHDQDETYYTSKVEDFDDQYLTIAMPTDKGYPVIPAIGEVIFGRLRTSEGVFKFVSVFIDKAAKPIPVLRIMLPKEMDKHQQREFVRVETRIPVKVCFEDEDKNLSDPYVTYSKDLSGGGIRIVMDRDVEAGSRVHVTTSELPGIGVLRIYCEVVRTVKAVANGKIYWMGTKFIDLPQAMQRNLIRFIFQKQRELLAKKMP